MHSVAAGCQATSESKSPHRSHIQPQRRPSSRSLTTSLQWWSVDKVFGNHFYFKKLIMSCCYDSSCYISWRCTEMHKLCSRLREVLSCNSLTVLSGPAWVSLNYIWHHFIWSILKVYTVGQICLTRGSSRSNIGLLLRML